MRKTMLAALFVTAASVLTVPAFAQDNAPAAKTEASTTTAGAAAKDSAMSAKSSTDATASKASEAGHKAKHSTHKAKAAATDTSKTDGGAPATPKQ